MKNTKMENTKMENTKNNVYSPKRVRAVLNVVQNGNSKMGKAMNGLFENKNKMQGLANRLIHGDKRRK